MKFFRFYIFFVFMLLYQCIAAEMVEKSKLVSGNKTRENMISGKSIGVKKKVLSNGMTVLVREVHTLPKVSIQLFYNVGSKDEKTGEKGIAHLIEHMVFKGTKKMLSETDIKFLANKLSGSCNAFTSFDYTGYLFNMPSHHWEAVLPIMADCMEHCAFNDEHLNSEMKTVIQELKMYNDHFFRKLFKQMLSTIFSDHPYRDPIIGYKQDVWGMRGANLHAFYKKYYVPNNATLVVVGDVVADNVFKLAQKYFGSIPSNKNYKKKKFSFSKDIVSKSVILQRDIKQPFVMLGYVIPGMDAQLDHVMDVIELILGKGKGSRLYRKIVDQHKLATSFDADSLRLFDHGLFLFCFEPKNIDDIDKIEEMIKNEIASIVKNGVSQKELERAVNQSKMAYYSKLENIQSQGYDIAKYFLATGSESYALEYLDKLEGEIESEIVAILAQYFRPAVMHKGIVLPLDTLEKPEWDKIQKESDKKDAEVLAKRERKLPIEEPKYALTVDVKKPEQFDFPKSKMFMLSNGIKVLYYDNKNTPKVTVLLELQAKSYYDPDDMQGLYRFVTSMMMEGTKKYTSEQLADEIEIRGMSLNISPGLVSMNMLGSDLSQGIEILQEVVSSPRFDSKDIEKVRDQLLTDIKNFWDDQGSITGQLLQQNIYKGHPYSKNALGTNESIRKIQKDNLVAFHKQYISPYGAKLVLVGDLPSEEKLKKILEEKLSQWSGPEIKKIDFPPLKPVKKSVVDFYINRDQLYLALANLSIDRKNKDYDKLLLFDQVFGGGALHNMYSKLYQIREQTGLFYKFFGSLTQNSGIQPGIVLVEGVISLDRLDEAENIIKKTIDTSAETLSALELDQAKHAVANALVNNFESNKKIAAAFLFLDKYNFDPDYFDNRAAQLEAISLDDVQEAVKNVLHSDSMLTLRVGRIGETNNA